MIIACALISISINPLFFKLLEYLQAPKLEVKSREWRSHKDHPSQDKAVVVGYGLIGQSVVKTLEIKGFRTVIIDRNVDTIAKLTEENRDAVFGDASYPTMLEMAQLESSSLLVITIPDLQATLNIIHFATQIKPAIAMIARVHFSRDKEILKQAGVTYICCEEEDVSGSFDACVSHLVEVSKNG